MGYRHYVGYIPKENLQKVLGHVRYLKSVIGTPRVSEDGLLIDEDDCYTDFDVTEYLHDQAFTLIELGKLYYENTDPIYRTLYANKGDDYSNNDTEFFFINDPDHRFLYNLSVASMECWTNFLRKAKKNLESCISSEAPLTLDQCMELQEINDLFEQEIRCQEFGTKCVANKKQHTFSPFSDYQFNYMAAKFYFLHEDFDYENDVLCVFAY